MDHSICVIENSNIALAFSACLSKSWFAVGEILNGKPNTL